VDRSGLGRYRYFLFSPALTGASRRPSLSRSNTKKPWRHICRGNMTQPNHCYASFSITESRYSTSPGPELARSHRFAAFEKKVLPHPYSPRTALNPLPPSEIFRDLLVHRISELVQAHGQHVQAILRHGSTPERVEDLASSSGAQSGRAHAISNCVFSRLMFSAMVSVARSKDRTS
jgi:hypothetical protein